MPFLSLHAHVSFGRVGDRAVFLDLGRDRYFALDGETAAAFDAVRLRGGTVDRGEPAANRLLRTGLFVLKEIPGNLDPARCPAPACQSPARAAVRARDVASAWRILGRIRKTLRRRGLERVLEDQLRLAAGPTREVDMATLASRFGAARALLPIPSRCLADSLALRAWMAGHGAAPAIVFGVKLDPFAAHCWAQSGAMVLNDSPDRTREFTPVLVLP